MMRCELREASSVSGGGYRHSEEQLAIYHEGIQTVINALMRASKSGTKDPQIAALHAMGDST